MSTHGGGKPNVKDVHNYQHPTGPKGLDNRGPGLGGSNHGSAQKPSGGKSSGSPGIGGSKHPSGSQDCD